LLDVALLDLLHEALALEDITTKIGGKLPRHYENLIVRDFRKTRPDRVLLAQAVSRGAVGHQHRHATSAGEG
jgi:hypothetical protein